MRSSAIRLVLVAALAVAATLLLARPAAASSRYLPPVAGPVIDPFRAPAGPYAAGNRGIDFATTSGEPVRAPAAGEVVFAGQVGGTLHVVILDPDGIRTSLSFLATVGTTRGAHVEAGEIVGTAATSLHLGFRRGGTYLDPGPLLVGTPLDRPRLVPEDKGPLTPGEEASGLRRLLGAVVDAGAALRQVATSLLPGAIDPDALRAALAVAATAAGGEPALAARIVAAVGDELADRSPCTPSAVAAPDRPAARGGRRIVVLVGGLGSGSGAASILDLDPVRLGYAPRDVVQAGYLGGTAVDTPYGAAATLDGVDGPGARLAALLRDLAAANPGVPIDVVAHSMGGLVARAALALHREPPEPPVAHLVTIATPHGGADLARLAVAARAVPGMTEAEHVADGAELAVAPGSRSVSDLAPGSALLARLDAAAPPPGLRVRSIAGRTDLVVPSTRARLGWPGATTVVVDAPDGSGVHAHERLPGSPAAAREVALALADLAPTCRSRHDVLLDAAIAAAVTTDGP